MPNSTEFENFDRVMKIIVAAPPAPATKNGKPVKKRKKNAPRQERRLPRP